MTDGQYPTVDESLDRLHRAGRRVGHTGGATLWLVSGSNGENAISATGKILAEAYWGVAESTVRHRCQALGVERLNEGSARLRRLNQEIGASLRGKRLPPDQVETGRGGHRRLHATYTDP